VTGCDDGKIRIWDLNQGKCIRVLLTVHNKNVVIINAGDKRFISCCRAVVRVWNSITYQRKKFLFNFDSDAKKYSKLSPNTIRYFMDQSDREKIICCSDSGYIIWDMKTTTVDKILKCSDLEYQHHLLVIVASINTLGFTKLITCEVNDI